MMRTGALGDALHRSLTSCQAHLLLTLVHSVRSELGLYEPSDFQANSLPMSRYRGAILRHTATAVKLPASAPVCTKRSEKPDRWIQSYYSGLRSGALKSGPSKHDHRRTTTSTPLPIIHGDHFERRLIHPVSAKRHIRKIKSHSPQIISLAQSLQQCKCFSLDGQMSPGR